jgi:hypothetical protein
MEPRRTIAQLRKLVESSNEPAELRHDMLRLVEELARRYAPSVTEERPDVEPCSVCGKRLLGQPADPSRQA